MEQSPSPPEFNPKSGLQTGSKQEVVAFKKWLFANVVSLTEDQRKGLKDSGLLSKLGSFSSSEINLVNNILIIPVTFGDELRPARAWLGTARGRVGVSRRGSVKSAEQKGRSGEGGSENITTVEIPPEALDIEANKKRVKQLLAAKGFGKAGGRGSSLDTCPVFKQYRQLLRAGRALSHEGKGNQEKYNRILSALEVSIGSLPEAKNGPELLQAYAEPPFRDAESIKQTYTPQEELQALKDKIESAKELNEKINAIVELAQADTKDLHITFDSAKTSDAMVRKQIVLAKNFVSEKFRNLISTLNSESPNEQEVTTTFLEWKAFVEEVENVALQQKATDQDTLDAEFSPALRKILNIPSVNELTMDEIIQSNKTSKDPVVEAQHNLADDVVKLQYDNTKEYVNASSNIDDTQRKTLLTQLEENRRVYIHALGGSDGVPVTGQDLSNALEIWKQAVSQIVTEEQKSPEKRLYENKRQEWLEAKRSLKEIGSDYFGEENKKEQKRIAQALYDKSKLLGIPYLGMLFKRGRKELKLEQGKNQKSYESYTLAQQKYAQALKEALSMRTSYREENKRGFEIVKAKLGARFFAKEGDEGFRADKSYLVNELVFNREILPEKKKIPFSKAVSIWQKMPYKTKMLFGGAAVGAFGAVTGGLAYAPSALMRWALGATVGVAAAGIVSGAIMKAGEPMLKRQRERVLQTRKESIDAFDPEYFFISKELIAKTEKRLKQREVITKGVATGAGLGAAYVFGRGLSEGIAQYQSIPTISTATGVPSWEQTGRGLPLNAVGSPSLTDNVPGSGRGDVPAGDNGYREESITKQQSMGNASPFADKTTPFGPSTVVPDAGPKVGVSPDGISPKLDVQKLPNFFPPDTPPNIDTVVPRGEHSLVLQGTPNANTVSEQILSAWKDGKLNHLGWVPEPGEMSSREFLDTMNRYIDPNSPDFMSPEEIRSMDIESGDFTKMPVGDEYDAVPLLEKMFNPEATPNASETSVRPLPRPTLAPETSIRPEARPNLDPNETSPRPLPRPTLPEPSQSPTKPLVQMPKYIPIPGPGDRSA